MEFCKNKRMYSSWSLKSNPHIKKNDFENALANVTSIHKHAINKAAMLKFTEKLRYGRGKACKIK